MATMPLRAGTGVHPDCATDARSVAAVASKQTQTTAFKKVAEWWPLTAAPNWERLRQPPLEVLIICNNLPSRMTKPAFTSLRRVEPLVFLPFNRRISCDDQLRDTIAATDLKRMAPVIDQHHANLSAIIGIDRTRRVQYTHAVLDRQAAPWSNLSLTP